MRIMIYRELEVLSVICKTVKCVPALITSSLHVGSQKITMNENTVIKYTVVFLD